jgi:Eco57I restriction-modification methylase
VSTRPVELFTTIHTEGGLLPPSLLEGIAFTSVDLPGLTADSYHLATGERLTEAISRSWSRLVGAWAGFRDTLAGVAAENPAHGLTYDRWLLILFSELGYGRLPRAAAVEIDQRSYPVSHAWGNVPIHLLGAHVDLDHRAPGVAGAARVSPHALVQDLLNRSDERLWGFVSNGLRLRILRDNAALTRQAYVEFDLEAMMDGGVYSDFTVLWLLAHQSRVETTPPEDCLLERWCNEARTQGVRALNQLRDGVETAIVQLGSGFLTHPANTALRKALRTGELDRIDYYRQLLRVVYRLLFLLVAEHRDQLLLRTAPTEASRRYTDYYSITRIRQLAERRRGTRHGDLWAQIRLVSRLLGTTGHPGLALPALGGELFSDRATPQLDTSELANTAVLAAVRALSGRDDDRARQRWLFDYRNLGSDELGSVYEALLELQPQPDVDAGTFELVTMGGHERKMTGSYYTHSALIVTMLSLALDPLLDEAAHNAAAEQAILDLKVIDPACGSGHFLVAAAHRIARRLAAVRTGEAEPNPTAARTALRDVIGHCVYGIDRNPMAVELCKVSLWMDALEPGKPLSFLDHHIVCGDAILGATPALLAQPVPAAAFTAVFDDDKKHLARLRARNRHEAAGQGVLDLAFTARDHIRPIAVATAGIDAIGDDTVDQIVEKERRYAELVASADAQRATLAADAWCAAFLVPKRPDVPAITEDVVYRLNGNSDALPADAVQCVQQIAAHYRLLHPHLAFPAVLTPPGNGDATSSGWTGGFDLVIGNPPWDTLSPDRKEFFSAYDPQIRFANKTEQTAIVDRLLQEPEIDRRWNEYQRDLYAGVHLIKNSGRYTLFAPGNLGKGDFNIYRMFVEASMQLTRPGGYVAQVLPNGFYGGANAMAIRKELYEHWQLRAVLGFINTGEQWFNSVDATTRFCLYAARRGRSTKTVEVAFELRTPADLARALDSASIHLNVDTIREQSPDALAIPEIANASDVQLVERMYAPWPKLGDETAGSPIRHYQTEIHMGNDRDLFGEHEDGLPLYEGRMIDQYDHRAKAWRSGRGRAAVWEQLRFDTPDKAIVPQWRVPRSNIPSKLGDRTDCYRIGFGDVTAPRNERSLIAALIPPGTICGHKVPTIVFPDGWEWFYMIWLAVANSFSLDFLLRKKVALSVTYTVLDSMPFPRLPLDHPAVSRLGPLALRLTCTAPEMTDYWNSMATHGWCQPVPTGTTPPGLIDEEDRAKAKAAIDAIVARDIFGLSANELAAILDTFPVLHRREKRAYGEFRTKQIVLDHFKELT